MPGVNSSQDWADDERKLQQLREHLAHSVAQAESGLVQDGDDVFDDLMQDLQNQTT